MRDTEWTKVRTALLASSTPEWAKDSIATAPQAPPPCVKLETHRITDSYIGFLREQIELGARGPEWNLILQRRMAALMPFVGVELTRMTLRCDHRVLVVDIFLTEQRVVHFEDRTIE